MAERYIVVLAHSDGWGALSANKVVRHIHQEYSDLGIHLIVSQATKNKSGGIATKLDDLKIPRALKETHLLDYFNRIDALYDAMRPYRELIREWDAVRAADGENMSHLSPGERAEYYCGLGMQIARHQSASLLTFQQLAKSYCRDAEVHYTSRGGPVGGNEVAAIIEGLEKKNGYGPELLLSVDTMAILPGELLTRYNCFSAHPGPLDDIKVEGMQGTLRSLANQILYDRNGNPLPANHIFGMGEAYIKGTLFMQHPELDKGPPLKIVKTFVCPGMCAYQARGEVYDVLTDAMLGLLPKLLEENSRSILIEAAATEKEILDAKPHTRIQELEADQLARWQGQAVGFANGAGPWGVEVIQNQIINPDYFECEMRRFFPGSEAEFKGNFVEIFGDTLDELAEQSDARLTDPWARLYAGNTDVEITRYDPKTGDVIEVFRNTGPSG